MHILNKDKSQTDDSNKPKIILQGYKTNIPLRSSFGI